MNFTNAQKNALIANLPKHQLANFARSNYSIDVYLEAVLNTMPDEGTLDYFRFREKRQEEDDLWDEIGMVPEYVRSTFRQPS